MNVYDQIQSGDLPLSLKRRALRGHEKAARSALNRYRHWAFQVRGWRKGRRVVLSQTARVVLRFGSPEQRAELIQLQEDA